MFISNSPSPFTTCFYQLFSQSTTKQGEGEHPPPPPRPVGANIVHELLVISIPPVLWTNNPAPICSGKGHGVNRGKECFGEKILFSNDTEVIWVSLSDFIGAFCRLKMFDPEVPVSPVVNGSRSGVTAPESETFYN